MPAQDNINLEHILNHGTLQRKKQVHDREIKTLSSHVKECKTETDIKTLIKALKAANKAKESHAKLLHKLQKKEREIAILKLELDTKKKPLSPKKLQKKNAKIVELEKENVAKQQVVKNHNIADKQMINILQQQINHKSIKLHEVNKNFQHVMQGKRKYIDIENECIELRGEIERYKDTAAQHEAEIESLKHKVNFITAKQQGQLNAHRNLTNELMADLEKKDAQIAELEETASEVEHLRALIRKNNAKFVAMKKQLVEDMRASLAKGQSDCMTVINADMSAYGYEL